MRMVLLVLGLMAWPVLATAQQFPAQFTVAGVAADDVLNIRALPLAGSDKLGEIAPDQMNVEVVRLSDDGRWGLVGRREFSGWVAMRFLVRQEVDAGRIPRPLRCLGTEPFWSLGLLQGGEEFTTPDDSQPLSLISEAVAAGGFLAFLADPAGGVWTLTIAAQQCSDGMTDRSFGWRGVVFQQGEGGNSLRNGCCTLDGG